MAQRWIIGLGNHTMADDAVGLRIAEAIAQGHPSADYGVDCLPDSGIRLLDFFTTETEKVILIDAMSAGKAPGEFFFFGPDDVNNWKRLANRSTHEGDLLSVIRLGSEMGLPLPRIVIMGIEPREIECRIGLSDLLQSRLSSYVEAAIRETGSK
jgi:hydrogenase maturation protease